MKITSYKISLTALLFFLHFFLFAQKKTAEYYQKKVDSLKIALKTAKSQKKPLARYYMHLTDYYLDLFKIDSSFYYATEGIEIAKKEKDAAAECRMWGLMASLTYFTGDFENGITWAKKSLEIAQQAGLDSMVVTRLNIVGLFYIETGRNQEALQYYEKALQVFENLPESKKSDYVKGDLYRIYANYAEAQENLGEYEKAILLHEKSYEEAKKQQAYRAMAIARNHLAECHQMLKNYTLPPKYLQEAIELSKQAQDLDMLNQSVLGMSGFYTKQRNFSEAEKYLAQSRKIITEDSNRVSIKSKRNHYQQALALSKEKGDFEQATRYVEKLREIDKLIYQQKSSYALDIANVEYKTLEKEQKAIQAENEKKKAQNFLLITLIVGLTAIAALSIWLFIEARNKLQKERELQIVKSEKEKEMRLSELKAQEAERERIAKDLHDGLGVTLSVIRQNIERATQTYAKDILMQANELVLEASQDVRRISHNLMPPTLKKFGLVSALSSFCQNIQNPPVIFSAIGFEKRLNENAEMLIFRIAQEAINNAIKYAQATEIFVQIYEDEGMLTLQIEDNGKGFDVKEAKNGLGMSSMRSRADLLGAELSVESEKDRGTVVLLTWKMYE
ncbi:tetratricopeptide repeat-containing sensor histidine kinase [Raineya sp.]|jgi:signal transduction histidine kinase